MYMKRVHTHKRTKRTHRRNYKANRGGAWYDIFTGKTEQPLNQNREQSEQQQGLFSRFTGAFNKTRQNIRNQYIVRKYKAEQGVKDLREKLTWLPGVGSSKTNNNPNTNQPHPQQPQQQIRVNTGGSKCIRHKTKKTRNPKRDTRRYRR